MHTDMKDIPYKFVCLFFFQGILKNVTILESLEFYLGARRVKVLK